MNNMNNNNNNNMDNKKINQRTKPSSKDGRRPCMTIPTFGSVVCDLRGPDSSHCFVESVNEPFFRTDQRVSRSSKRQSARSGT